MKRRRKTKTLVRFLSAREATPAQIVADAAIAVGSIADGRFLPVLIVDTATRTDVEELIRIHGDFSPGDASTTWLQVEGRNGTVSLLVDFERPVELRLLLEFNIETQGSVVDLILRSGGFYLQAGRAGDRFITTRDARRILIEVPDSGFRPRWDELFLKSAEAVFRKRGLNRASARRAARDFVSEMRRFVGFRTPP